MIPKQLPFPVTRRRLSEVTLEVAAAGCPGQPLVLLLHGFPDVWQTWHAQMSALAAEGWRVLAPHLRGYGGSDRPAGIEPYDIDHLARDIVELADSESPEAFDLVGHDWGGLVAWRVAIKAPGRVRRLAIINAPHPGVFRSVLRRHPGQLVRSWYVGAFQIPWLPEWVLSLNRHALLFRTVQMSSRPGVFDDSDRTIMNLAWSEPGALTAMLNYYRAIVRRDDHSLAGRVLCPAQILFGRRDPTEMPALAEANCRECEFGDIVWFSDCAHWPHREDPLRTTRILLEFLR